MSFTDLIKKKTQAKKEEFDTKASVDDWKDTVPEGYDFDKVVNAPKEPCPRCEKMILVEELESHKSSHSSEVIDGFLFLGGERNAKNKKELTTRTNINVILCVSGESVEDFPGEFRYHQYLFKDSKEQQIAEHFEEIFAIIDEAKGNNERILVHCVQGISRSASVVIAYCMKSNEWSLKKSYDFVKSKRKIISPNVGFIKQLQQYEKLLFGTEEPTLTVEDVYGDCSSMINVGE